MSTEFFNFRLFILNINIIYYDLKNKYMDKNNIIKRCQNDYNWVNSKF